MLRVGEAQLKLRSLSSLVALLAIVTPLIAGAQQATFADVANGVALPNSMKIADLSADYRAMKIQSAGNLDGALGGNMETYYMYARSVSQMGTEAGEVSNGSFMRMFQLQDVVWTKGQMMSVQGHDYLVGYRLAISMDSVPLADGATTPPRWTANLVLKLTRNDMVSSIESEPDMTPDVLRRLLRQGHVALDVSGARGPGQVDAMGPSAQSRMYSNAKQIALSLMMYANDYDDQFPYVQGTPQLQKLVRPYVKNDTLWKSLNPAGSDFRFAMNLAGVASSMLPEPNRTPMLYESNPWADGRRIVAFVDSHVKIVSADEWKGIEPWLKRKYPREAKKPIKG